MNKHIYDVHIKINGKFSIFSFIPCRLGVFDTRASMFTSSTGVFKSKGRRLRKTLTKVTGTDDVDPPQTSCEERRVLVFGLFTFYLDRNYF